MICEPRAHYEKKIGGSMMDNLVTVEGNDIFTDSMVVADGTNNKHRSVQRIIEKHISSIEEFGKVRFQITPSVKGQEQKIYQLSEQQATFLVTMLRNTEVVIKFKINLVKQFYQMRQLLMERQSTEWQSLRQQTKDVRRLETDTIQQFVEYAKNQGSTRATHYYTNLTKLVNKAAGIQSRNFATGLQLNTVMFLERMIGEALRQGMRQEKEYRDIYDLCKSKVLTIKELALLESVA